MLKIKIYNFSLNIFLLLFLLGVGNNTGHAQLTVQSGMVQQSNQYTAQLCDNCSNSAIAQDLFFSIGPNGVPQYGRDVSWNLEENTSGTARFYQVKKGDWDRSAIKTAEDNINFISSPTNHSPSATPSVNMNSDWIKIGRSWNFSHDNYALAIISFTNQSPIKIKSGTITFSHEMLSFIDVQDIIIYNEWVKLISTHAVSGRKVFTFSYENLEPEEIRYLYVKVDITKGSSFRIPSTSLQVEMTGHQTASTDIGGTVPPHDPNALTLQTALDNTPPSINCSDYASYPNLEEACSKGKPFWVSCPNTGDLKCPLAHSLNYPYCHSDSETLTYRIDCLNEGQGIAKDINMTNIFDPQYSPFDPNVFTYTASHPVSAAQQYPRTQFIFENINLPGLLNEQHVYTYDECSASATFTVKTLCNQEIEISAQTSIIFYATNDEAEDPINTNIVTIVPEQGVYDNYTPTCESCGFGSESKAEKYEPQDFKLVASNHQLDITFDRESKDNNVAINIFNMEGRVMHKLKLSPNGYSSVSESIDVSNFASGIYFLSVQDGSKNYIEKIFHY